MVDVQCLSDAELQNQLKKLGFSPGPILRMYTQTQRTKPLSFAIYLQRWKITLTRGNICNKNHANRDRETELVAQFLVPRMCGALCSISSTVSPSEWGNRKSYTQRESLQFNTYDARKDCFFLFFFNSETLLFFIILPCFVLAICSVLTSYSCMCLLSVFLICRVRYTIMAILF